ncbi:MAG: peptidoglycan DD-metalloendopeptidase family protein [Betaproteobacteria bacterium]|jgi:murein DD-endopeptidase MepM/ murein hydrolase activator NlpD
MQIIWVSGPTSRVVTMSITARAIGLGFAGLCCLMLTLGMLFHFVGLRMAVELSPSVAQAIGGVASAAEHERMQLHYRREVQELQVRANEVLERLGQLEQSRQDLLALLGVRQGGIPRQPFADRIGQGGPLRLLELLDPRNPALDGELQQASLKLSRLDASLDQVHARWTDESQRLQQLPSGLPILGDFYMSSGYGTRPDPLTGQRSLHEGVDFVAPVGTPVRASGGGHVRRSEFAGDHGHLVEVEHAEGYRSRYAHLKTRLVQPGDWVERGQIIGLLGNTGRTTGAHLHYEIEHQGKLIDPNRALAPLAWR